MFRGLWEAKTRVILLKIENFFIKVESNLLYRTRIARKFFIITRILEKAVKHGSKVSGHNSL